MPMPLGAEFAKILQAVRIDGHPRPRLVRTLLWLVGVIFGYQTVVWLSSLLLLVRATEQKFRPACWPAYQCEVSDRPFCAGIRVRTCFCGSIFLFHSEIVIFRFFVDI